MKEQFEQPKFIRADYTVKPFAKGGYVTTAGIEKEGESTQVLKQYDPEGLNQLFSPEERPLSLQEKAQILKKREELTHAFFATLSPNPVLKSLYVIGGDTMADARINAIQERVDIFESLLTLAASPDPISILEKKFTQEQIAHMGEEIISFVARAKEVLDPEKTKDHPELEGVLFDLLTDGNVVVDSSGHLKMFDTNMLFKPEGEGNYMQEWYRITLENFEALGKKLQTVATPV